jgi:hypothetical protein
MLRQQVTTAFASTVMRIAVDGVLASGCEAIAVQ